MNSLGDRSDLIAAELINPALLDQPALRSYVDHMGRKHGIYSLGHYTSLETSISKSLWNPLLNDFEKFDFSQMDLERPQDQEVLRQTLEGMQLTHQQILDGFFPMEDRIAALERLAREFSKSLENLVTIMAMEVAKPVNLGRGECERTLQTIEATIAAGKAALTQPELPALKGGGDFYGVSRPLPRGIVLGITPFNFPMNLCMHKIAPAILAGTPLIWRPSEKCLLANLALMDVLHAAKLPDGILAFLPMTHESSWKILQRPEISCVSFTGSAAVGWEIREKFKGPVVLELGGTAPIYLADNNQLAINLKTILSSAFGFAGQSCISAQNLLVEESIFAEVKQELEKVLNNFPVGDPYAEDTRCSGVVSAAACSKISATIEREKKLGAEIIQGPMHKELPNFVPPTLIFNPSLEMKTEEIFGPVLNIIPINGVKDFLQFANGLPHRLQAAVFANDEEILAACANHLDFGGVALNLASSVRVDALPYGGRGLAGIGVENPQSTFEFFAPQKTFYSKTSSF